MGLKAKVTAKVAETKAASKASGDALKKLAAEHPGNFPGLKRKR